MYLPSFNSSVRVSDLPLNGPRFDKTRLVQNRSLTDAITRFLHPERLHLGTLFSCEVHQGVKNDVLTVPLGNSRFDKTILTQNGTSTDVMARPSKLRFSRFASACRPTRWTPAKRILPSTPTVFVLWVAKLGVSFPDLSIVPGIPRGKPYI